MAIFFKGGFKMRIKMNKELAEAIVYGGVFLGGGGGGAIQNGLETASKALELGNIYLVSADEVDDGDMIITASAVGSPASKEGYIAVEHCTRVYELYQKIIGKNINGVITNENGGHSITNGWVLAASMGIPVIDAPCNGRAHPTGAMGSMGLSMVKDYETWQVCAGGDSKLGNYMEMATFGNLNKTSAMIRSASVQAGGLVTVLRNNANAEYIKKNAAVGGLSMAAKIGEVFLKNSGNFDNILKNLKKVVDVEVLVQGKISNLTLEIRNGLDIGYFNIVNDQNTEISFINEYMTVDIDDKRIATFPDLIVTMDKNTGEVKTSATIKENDQIAILKVPKKSLILGKGMNDITLMKDMEALLNKQLID